MRVGTRQALAQIELTESGSGRKLYIPDIQPGEADYVEKARAGTWCITGVSVAGHYGPPVASEERMCTSVAKASRGELGYVAFDGARLVPTPTRVNLVQEPGHENLGVTSIEEGMARVKPDVQRCMLEQHLPEGTVLRAKVRISGPTGKVTGAEVLAPFADHPVAPCVLGWLRDAVFTTFPETALGVVYPFVLRTENWNRAKKSP